MKRIILLGIGVAVLGIGAGVANADTGKLSCLNNTIQGGSATNNSCELVHATSRTDGYGFGDTPYFAMFSPDGWSSKIISRIDDSTYPELKVDGRDEYSTTPYDCELSLITEIGEPIDTTSWNSKANELDFNFPISYYFGNETITLQITQMNGDPAMVGNVYDLRKEIYYGSGTGVIPLPDLNGVYNSEEVYGKFSVYFDRNLADFNNDGIVDLLDFSLLAQEWGKTGNSLADIAIAVGNTGIVLPGTTTPYFDGVVDLADLIFFADNWLVE